jgi:hypothetical protein
MLIHSSFAAPVVQRPRPSAEPLDLPKVPPRGCGTNTAGLRFSTGTTWSVKMNSIVWLVGAVVIIIAVLNLVGFA